MTAAGILEAVCARRVVPVVVLEREDDAVRLARAMTAGGLPVAEIALRTDAALAALRLLAGEGEMLVGAGTVVRPEQVDQAVEAGARFVVAPGFSPAVAARCTELGVPFVPGVATASEVMAALERGFELLKFFPAETSGGAAALRALAGPFPDVRFVPTGGVGPANARAYLGLASVAAVGGSWMVARELIATGDFTRIEQLTRDAVRLAQP